MSVDIRQSELREEAPTCKQTTDGSTIGVNDLLVSIDNELQPPLRMRVTATHVVTVDSIYLTNPETGRQRTIPPVSNLIPLSFSSGTITIPAANNNNIVPSAGDQVLLNIPDGHYARVGVHLNPLGNFVLTIGDSNASLASATAPAVPNNVHAVGHIVVQNVSGTIQDLVADSSIWSYVGGGGAGGSGNANILETAIRDQLLLAPYALATPSIFETDQDTLVDASSTGSFSRVTNTYDLDNGETMVSKQLLDANEFLSVGKDVTSIDFTVFWNLNDICADATYEVSRDGGNNWQTVAMERISDNARSFYGSHSFTDEASWLDLLTQASGAIAHELNTTTSQKIAQAITIANSSVIREVDLFITKTGSPLGKLYITIYDDNGSDEPGDPISESLPIDVAGLSTGTLTVDVGSAPVIGGEKYHIVIRSDAAYKSSFSAGVDSISFTKDGSADGMIINNGSAWSDSSTDGLKYTVKGRELDLRVRITAGAATTGKLDGLGVFYDLQAGTVGGVYDSYQVSFDSVAQNWNEFTLPFQPDSRILRVYYLQAGQVFRYGPNSGSFSIVGRKVIFPANTFNNDGVSTTVTLQFEQLYGNTFDTSDYNHALMQENHLGSSDANVDRSSSGRGIILRNANGDLREIALDASDNITISTYP